LEPPKPPIELKPLPAILDMLFLIMIRNLLWS
jgi:hypothetical protein